MQELRKLFLATSNPSKIRECTAALADLPLVLKKISDLKNPPAEPSETGATFEENARIKAEFWCQQTGYPTLADDSGILVDALPGELGVRTARFGVGESASDAEWLAHFLERMKNVPLEKRKAQFVSVLAFARSGAPTKFFRGEVEGVITTAPKAELLPRIPLSSVFRAQGTIKVFAAMTAVEKSRWSHRGRALELAKKFLENLSRN